MGIGASTAAGLENPFPIEPAMEKDLMRLSYVVSRLLNKPDLYDLNNLARPGACGDYAVFLKEKLERRLMPFVADICGEKLAVVYQNPLKSFDTVEKRKLVCQDLANTIIRLVSIVVACLASIQFESPRAREAAGVPAAAPVTQRGGSDNVSRAAGSDSDSEEEDDLTFSQWSQRGGGAETDIVRWLQQNKYVASNYVPDPTSPRIQIPLQDPGFIDKSYMSVTTEPQFLLQLNREAESDGVYKGYITVTQGGTPSLPLTGFLKAYFMRPIPIIPTTGASILPINIVDGTGVTWMCGVLYTHMFLSLATNNRAAHPFELLTSIFRQAQPDVTQTENILEPRPALIQAENVFNTARSQRSPQAILQALAPTLSRLAGYSPSLTPGYGLGAVAGTPGLGVGGLLLPRRPTTAAAYGAAALRPGELTAAEYVIPPPAAKSILTTFRKHAGEIGAANNPAQIRATLLAGEVLRDRTIQTRICQDPYWNATNLSSVYPWAALQFLCIDNYRALGETTVAAARPLEVVPTPAGGAGIGQPAPAPSRPAAPVSATARPKLVPEWTRFLSELRDLYRGEEAGLPSLSAPAGSSPSAQMLEDIRFVNVAKARGCDKPGRSPRARFQEIQNGVLRLQGLYEEHAKEVWKILNSLIYLIEDPDSKAELVRLNPKVFAGGDSTRSFIDEKAGEARKLLIEYYLAIERTYTETIQRMRVLT
jgi:hypothetical protein